MPNDTTARNDAYLGTSVPRAVADKIRELALNDQRSTASYLRVLFTEHAKESE